MAELIDQKKRKGKAQASPVELAQGIAGSSVQGTSAGKALQSVFAGWGMVNQQEALQVSLPATGAAYFAMGRFNNEAEKKEVDRALGQACGGDFIAKDRKLPLNRSARYAVFRAMAEDPTIDSAIKMHVANALAAKSDETNAVYIDTAEEGKENKIVDELRAVLMPFIEKDLSEWARKAAVYGSCFTRVYGEVGVGIENIRCDFYTHPRFIQKYEKGGRLAGFTCSYQGANSHGRQIQLLPPWTIVGFEIPEWDDLEHIEPVRVNGVPVDLSIEDYQVEGLVESQEYGRSLLATAYGPWMDLQDAVLSLIMSRRNAARLERLVGVATGKLDPERAARYIDMIAERISNASNEVQTASYLNGTVQTIVNHMFPIYGDKGGIQIDSVQGTADINGLEDVMFHIKRLGGALGIDPSLLGFSDFLSGGLGDGGFFRMSLLAGTKAHLLRKAIENGLQRLCDIHVAYKYGKVFTPEERPWKIRFNSISSAIEREEQESLESRTNVCQGMVATLATIDQEFSIIDRRELGRSLWKRMHLDEKEFELVFPEEKAKKAAKAEEEGMMGGQGAPMGNMHEMQDRVGADLDLGEGE